EFVKRLATELLPEPFSQRSLLGPETLFCRTEADFLKLDLSIQICDAALAVLSSTTLTRMEQDPIFTSQLLDMMRSRTGSLIALCTSHECIESVKKWDFHQIIDSSVFPSDGVSLTQFLRRKLGAVQIRSLVPAIGIPLVIAAMT